MEYAVSCMKMHHYGTMQSLCQQVPKLLDPIETDFGKSVPKVPDTGKSVLLLDSTF